MADVDPLAPPDWYPQTTAPAQSPWQPPVMPVHPKLDLSTGELYIAPIPACPVHGALHWDFARDLYYCPGYDAGDCSMTVTTESLTWQHLGHVDG